MEDQKKVETKEKYAQKQRRIDGRARRKRSIEGETTC